MDWDDAYANGAYIKGAEQYPSRWSAEASAFRAATPHDTLSYGSDPRQQMDLFFPGDVPKGLFVFVHGGYWLNFDKSSWSHLAAGAIAMGYAVAVPSYPLAPDATVPQITASVARAVQMAADAVPGQVRLAGHSAGGHLVARMLNEDVDLPCRDRIKRVVPISPVADLRPLMKTKMGPQLHLDDTVCARESPVLTPPPDAPVTVWVGAEERPVFIEQAQDLAQAWDCALHIAPGKHHFDVIAGLSDPQDPLLRAVFS